MSETNDFAAWLQSEMDKRDWKQADLVRRSGVNGGLLSQVLSRQRRPGVEFCKRIATTFGLSDVTVLRIAGRADEPPELSQTIESVSNMLAELSEEDQEEILAIVRVKYDRKHKLP